MILFFITLLVIPFGLIFLLGAPYVPAHRKAIEAAVDGLRLSKNGRVLDLGCGDGKFLMAAAKKGYKCTGYEANPLLFVFTRLRLLRFKTAKVRFGNLWNVRFPDDTEVVYIFLLEKFMPRIDQKMDNEARRLGKDLTLMSYVFKIPQKKFVSEKSGVRVYEYAPK